MIKAVIFDMDGVLVDNRDVHIESFSTWCQSRNLNIDKNELVSYFGMGNDEIFPLILKRDDLTEQDIIQFSQEKEAIYRDMIAAEIKPLKGLVELLESLKKKGIKIAVGSSGIRENVNFVLEKCNISKYFDAISDGSMASKAKPDPEVFNTAAQLLNLPNEECVVCEDSFAGVEASRRAGMKVVVLATTFAREQHNDFDILIDDFSQITADEILAL